MISLFYFFAYLFEAFISWMYMSKKIRIQNKKEIRVVVLWYLYSTAILNQLYRYSAAESGNLFHLQLPALLDLLQNQIFTTAFQLHIPVGDNAYY